MNARRVRIGDYFVTLGKVKKRSQRKETGRRPNLFAAPLFFWRSVQKEHVASEKLENSLNSTGI